MIVRIVQHGSATAISYVGRVDKVIDIAGLGSWKASRATVLDTLDSIIEDGFFESTVGTASTRQVEELNKFRGRCPNVFSTATWEESSSTVFRFMFLAVAAFLMSSEVLQISLALQLKLFEVGLAKCMGQSCVWGLRCPVVSHLVCRRVRRTALRAQGSKAPLCAVFLGFAVPSLPSRKALERSDTRLRWSGVVAGSSSDLALAGDQQQVVRRCALCDDPYGSGAAVLVTSSHVSPCAEKRTTTGTHGERATHTHVTARVTRT